MGKVDLCQSHTRALHQIFSSRSPRRRSRAVSGYGEAERLGGLEIDHELELDWGLDGKLVRFLALEDAIDIGRRSPKILGQVNAVGHQATDVSEVKRIDGRGR